MTTRTFGSLILMLSLVACAKPNFEDAQSLPSVPGSPAVDESISSSCAYQFPKEKLCLKMEWEKKASSEETGSFLMTFFEQNVDSSSLTVRDPQSAPKVVLWMPSMGHGSSPVKIEKVGTGVYRATNVFFVMPGSWEIHVKLSSGDEIIEKVEI